jgi:hypothetical protein
VSLELEREYFVLEEIQVFEGLYILKTLPSLIVTHETESYTCESYGNFDQINLKELICKVGNFLCQEAVIIINDIEPMVLN